MRKCKTLGLAFVLVAISQCLAQARDSFDFAAYPVGTSYQGRMQLPDFKARDKKFALFKTRIVEAMKEGVSFAGEYSIAQFGCGSGCTSVVVANNRTGELFDFPRGGEFNQALTLEFKANSKLMFARWYTDSLWETCVIESFVFDDGQWIAKDALAGNGDAVCSGNVAQGAIRARDF